MEAQEKTLGRRGILAGSVGALVAAALGRGATAKAENGEALVLGEANSASETTSLNRTKQPDPTGANGGGTGDAFEVASGRGSTRARGRLSTAPAVFGQVGKPRQSQPWTTAAAGGPPAGRTRERSGSRIRTSG